MADNLAQMMTQSPLVGSAMFGQREAMAQQQEEMKRQELAQTIAKMQQEYAHTQQMNPLKVENQGLQNRGLQAELPGKTADAQRRVLETEEFGRTSEGRVGATNSGNRLKMLGDGIKQGQMIDGVVTQALSEIESIPAPARMARLREIAMDHQVDVNNPQVQRILAAAAQNPAILMQIKQKTAQRMAQMTPEYQREWMKEQEANKRNKETTNAQRYVADKGAESRVAAASARGKATGNDILTRLKEGRVSPANAAAQFEVLAAMSEDERERAQFSKLAETMNKLALQLNPKPQSADLGAVGITSAQPPAPVAGQAGKANKPKGTGTADDPIVLE